MDVQLARRRAPARSKAKTVSASQLVPGARSMRTRGLGMAVFVDFRCLTNRGAIARRISGFREDSSIKRLLLVSVSRTNEVLCVYRCAAHAAKRQAVEVSFEARLCVLLGIDLAEESRV